MRKQIESLDEYLEEGKLLLVGEIFSRKKEIGDKLRLQRRESHKIALSRRRKQDAGRNSSFSWRVAAAIVPLLGVGGYFLAEEKVVTDSTTMNYELPDGSAVQVIENSRLTYDHITQPWERKLQLLDRASFSVTRSKTFTVRTEAGDVTVLGTKFLINQQGGKVTVNCKEGSVQVETAVGKHVLFAGESVHCNEDKIVPVEKKAEESEFPEVLGYEDDPLINVVADVEHIFEVTVVGHEKCEGLAYSGTALAKGLNAILEKVFESCGVSYQIRGKGIILQ